jgi:hypothetical protein
MYQFNLYKNDIIIILVLFSIFCVFLYITNIKYNEHFNNKIVLVNSNENKINIKKSFEHFFELFERHILILNDINNQSITIINKFNNNNININTNINNISNFLDSIIINEELKETTPIDKEFNLLFININDLFNTHKKLFNNPSNNDFFRDWDFTIKDGKWVNKDSDLRTTSSTTSSTPSTPSSTPSSTTSSTPSSTTSSRTTSSTPSSTTERFYGGSSNGSDLCYSLNLVETDPISFYYNLSSQLDVIQSKNISQLKLIKININKIKSMISTINDIISFDPTISLDIVKALDDYYNLLDTMYNKDSTNIFNIIYDQITIKKDDTDADECKEITYDIFKLEDIRANIKDTNLKSFKKLNGDFKYYDLDKIFIRSYKPNDHFKETKAGLKLWQSFCEKLKKLNKPNKGNIILKKFNLDLIEKKNKFIKELETNIYDIQNKMTHNQLEQYNINKLRTHEQANKQYEAIKKGIDNIKNKNKIKINLT